MVYTDFMMKKILLLIIIIFAGCTKTISIDLCTGIVCDFDEACDSKSGQCIRRCAYVVCESEQFCDVYTGECRVPQTEEGEVLCDDGVDNDGDLNIDCDDTKCSTSLVCAHENDDISCSDGLDNDSDGYFDCSDTDCSNLPICNQENSNVLCSDGEDNDSDGDFDCDDEDCQSESITVCSTSVENDGWIGGNCEFSSDCEYDGAFCIDASPFLGMCSSSCDLYCPDSTEINHSITFCIENPLQDGTGICVARCDYELFPVSGCREDYVCVADSRFNQPTTTQTVCLPPGDETPACTSSDVPQPNAGITSPAGIDGCPSGMKPIGGGNVCMDIWEAHLVEVVSPGNYIPHSPYFNPGTKTVMAVSASSAVPQGYVTQVQATSACVEAGKRLCSNSEWELACRTASDNIYPYGNTREPGWCNDARTPHPVVEYFGTSDSWIWSELGHSCINQLENSLDLTGSNPQCVTSEGFFDLMGNLHEWTSDSAGTFKGGYYVDTVINGNGCLYQTTAHNVYHWDYSTGFRCCADK
jgi:Sulfatase-modifying factor enzyme 1